MSIDATKPIPAKRKLFAERYLVCLNATQAAIEAKYAKGRAKQTGYDLLKDPRVLEIIHAGGQKLSEQNGIDAAYVLNGAREMFERCMQHFPVLNKKGKQVYVKTPNGDLVPAYVFDSSGAARALKLVGEHIQVNAFKATDANNVPIDQNWVTTIVHTDAKSYAARKT